MPCNAATIKQAISVSTEDTVEKVIDVLREHQIDAVPVLDKNGKLEGVFSTRILLKNLLPVSVTTGDDILMDIKIGAAPGVAKRLKKVKPLKVSELMLRKMHIVAPSAPLWEGVNLLVHHGSPILVVEPETGKFIGMMTEQSVIDELERVQDKPEN